MGNPDEPDAYTNNRPRNPMIARVDAITGSTGRWLLSKFQRLLDQIAFLGVCVMVMIRFRTAGRRLIRRIIVEQIYFTGVQSLELISLLALISGAVMVLQAFTQLSKFGSLESLSIVLVVTLIREAGPLLTAVVIILRSGSAIALEIGYMNVLGEIEGLEMQGIPPLHFLCIPRLIGVAVSVLCLIILFDIISIAGGFLAGWIIQGMTLYNYVYGLTVAVQQSDFVIVLVKGICFGITIPTVCLYNGFLAQGAITAIPPRVSRALVDSLLYCVFLDIMIAVAFYFV